MRKEETAIVNKYLGILFRHRGRGMDGLDCYGLVLKVYEDLGIRLFDLETYEEDAASGKADYFIKNYYRDWRRIDTPSAFDVVLFKSRGITMHCGVVLSGDKFLHCSRKTCGVIVSRLHSGAWEKMIEGYYRIRSTR